MILSSLFRILDVLSLVRTEEHRLVVGRGDLGRGAYIVLV